MYESFYGLTRAPFAVTPDPAMLFMSKVHREALATIIYGVETRKGFIVCTGEVGTGKSTIIRAFFDQALADAVKLIYIFTPQVTPLEIAKYICREMQMEDPDSIFAAVPLLQMKLLEMFEAGKTVVLMIDEAQLLPPETLEFLRLLSNFETDTEKLIQIVLVGQPEVDTVLARRDMRQVNQRVALRARLAPLSGDESFEYIDHRIRVSGAGDLGQVMSPSAAWLVAEAAGGIPRVINILADNALIAGFGAGQRPLGSHLAGNTVREFLAKSGPAKPVAAQRFGPGWRAALRLRGALAREKDEPEEWVPAIPAPISKPTMPASRPLSPVSLAAVPPIVPPPIVPPPIAPPPIAPPPIAVAPRPLAVMAPPPVAPAPVAPAPITLAPEPIAVMVPPPAIPPPISPPRITLATELPILVEPVARSAPPAQPRPAVRSVSPPELAPEAAPLHGIIMVEPVLELPHDIAWGMPVSIEGLVMVAPIAADEPAHSPLAPPQPPEPAPPQIASSPPSDAESAGGRSSAAIPSRRRIPPPMPRPYLNGTDPAAPLPVPEPMRQEAQWPALSRVRSGLPPVPRRGWEPR